MTNEADLRRTILNELHSMSREQARTSTVLTYDVAEAAERHGVTDDEVANVLSDLSIEGLIEEYAATFSKSLITGHCRITGDGIRYLRG